VEKVETKKEKVRKYAKGESVKGAERIPGRTCVFILFNFTNMEDILCLWSA
jgi:hypothetical protein